MGTKSKFSAREKEKIVLRFFVTDIIDCKISLENLVNFCERRMLDFF